MADDNPDRGMPTKAELMASIDRAWAELWGAVGAPSAEDLARPGADGWSAKDHLAHLAAWERSLLALLRGESRAAALGVDAAAYAASGVDGINAAILERAADLPPADVLADLRRGHDRVLLVLAELTDADLARPYADVERKATDPPTLPIAGWIGMAAVDHVAEHLPRIRALLAPDGAA